MGVHRLKHTFTSGELSPLMGDRVDFDRHKDGCITLLNAMCLTQGPATRRPGLRYINDLGAAVGMDVANPVFRLVPFVFNELQAYALVFLKKADGTLVVVFATGDGLVTSGGSIVSLTLTAGWDIAKFDWAQTGDDLYIAQSGLSPRIIRRASHTSWSLVLPTFTSPPADWTVSNGYPERVTFHQQRLAFAANILRRQTVWCSKAGSFHDFGVSSPLVDSDAVTFTLDSGTQNRIQWILSGKALNVGTLGNEWTVSGGVQTALTPKSILSQRQTNNGSEANKPMLVGLTTLFVERHGRTINEFVYDYSFDSYKTADISILAPHLTDSYSISDWAYQQTPDSIIWCVRSDGVLLGLTYQREHKVVGWHRHTTQGEFEAICTIPGTVREDEVWFIIKRYIDGTWKYYLEKLDPRFTGTDATNAKFVDSYLTYSGAATQTVSGLTHLANMSVAVLADGSVHPPVTVSPTGVLTLNKAYSTITVGLPYTTEIMPQVPDVSLKSGTGLGRMQRITNIDIDLYKSLGMEIGRITQEGEVEIEEKPFRVPKDLTGQQVPLFTGWYHMDFPEGFDRQSLYFIRQTQPLPLTVRSIVDTVEVYE